MKPSKSSENQDILSSRISRGGQDRPVAKNILTRSSFQKDPINTTASVSQGMSIQNTISAKKEIEVHTIEDPTSSKTEI